MIERIVMELGPWNWMVLGFVLLALEIIVPGIFLMWIGLGALAVGALSLAIWDAAFWSWQVQTIVFLAASLGIAYAGNRLMGGGRESDTDQPLLNRRGAQLIGRTATLSEPIVNGHGRVKIGDTLWRISGPDLPTGATVRVTSVDKTDLDLTVEAVG
ncbi:NfeD family protein [Mesorhizobium sp. NBSH29]|uniref:NfeD family protein n=1 Tax=Mesorhizobium sp. NBSH29 TaxID=2654249 RepID=UPI001896A2BA|nr:NfeD family protein [Mesorhizobium sp. NBSH29]QPC85458.1 NfeD family protein [Mesorhizobium sp. NBSH29]